ncbi:hypothetical protein GS486_07760 [Rhodococcus hoagii]|nr:hypothetical protein [Prescottella equi]
MSENTITTLLAPQRAGIPLPEPTVLSKPFWDGCVAGELRYQRCTACGHRAFASERRPQVRSCRGHTEGPTLSRVGLRPFQGRRLGRSGVSGLQSGVRVPTRPRRTDDHRDRGQDDRCAERCRRCPRKPAGSPYRSVDRAGRAAAHPGSRCRTAARYRTVDAGARRRQAGPDHVPHPGR